MTGGSGRRSRLCEQDEAGDGAGVVGDVVGQDLQAVLPRRERGRDGRVDLAPGDLRGRLAGGRARRGRPRRAGGGRSSRGSGRCRGCARRPERTSATVVPARTMTANRTGSTTSLTIISGGSSSRPSRTGGTAPSTLFSMGTQPASACPSRTAVSTARLPTQGNSAASRASGRVSRACSAKVACGPRNASRGTVGEPNREAHRAHPRRPRADHRSRRRESLRRGVRTTRLGTWRSCVGVLEAVSRTPGRSDSAPGMGRSRTVGRGT